MAGYIGSKASVVSSGAERKKVFNITGATTSLTGCSYTVGKVQVFQNGVRLLDGTDYTATDGTTVTLTVAAQSGDNVVVLSQASFQVADAVLTSGGTITGNLTVETSADNGVVIEAHDNLTTTYPLKVQNNAGSGRLEIGTYGINNNIDLKIQTADTNRINVDTNGDISFYEDTGTTAKFFWDSSTERLGLGTSSPLSPLDVTLEATGQRRFLVNYDDSAITIKGSNGSSNPESLRAVTSTFKVNTGTSGSGAERMRIDSSGRVTMPSQPAFNVRLNTSNSTAPAGIDTVTFNQIVTNVGSHYSNSTGRFTAPVSGFYQINLLMYFQGGTSYVGSMLQKSDGTVYYNFSSVGSDVCVCTSQAVYLNQNDYLFTRTYCGGSTTLTRQYSYFSGYLIG